MDDSILEKLTRVMGSRTGLFSAVDAGYTYIGQFIAHDIVPSTQTDQTSRTVTRELNLDSVYGTGTQVQHLCDKDGRFIIDCRKGMPDDLPRDPTGMPLIPEKRNDENTIVAQLHLFWLKFHNFLIEKTYARNLAEARRLVTLVFQLVTVEDFLRQIIAPKVFDAYFRESPARWLSLNRLQIPREFSRAAFRFGHSMARERYNSLGSREKHTELADLFRTGRRLTANKEIIWTGFFGWSNQPSKDIVQNAMSIDPWVKPLSKIRDQRGREMNLILRNLQAGTGLPSGMEYLNAVLDSHNGNQIENRFELKPVTDVGHILKDAGIRRADDLPLWPYLLVEAWKQTTGEQLGTLGSLICAEVLRDSIQSAEHSIYDMNPCDTTSVLKSLGRLGTDLQQEMATSESAALTTIKRPFCMRHIIELQNRGEINE